MLAEGATRFSDTGNSRTALADGATLAGVTVNSMTRFKRNLKTANAWVPDEDDDPLRIALTLNAAAAPPAPAAEPADDSVDWKTSITVGNWSTRRGERERGWRVQDCVQTREDVSDIENHSPDDICYGSIGQKQFTVGSMTYMLEGVYHGVSSADDSVTMEFEGEADLTALADRAFIINGTTFWMFRRNYLGGHRQCPSHRVAGARMDPRRRMDAWLDCVGRAQGGNVTVTGGAAHDGHTRRQRAGARAVRDRSHVQRRRERLRRLRH